MSFCSFMDYPTFKCFALKSTCSAGKTSLVIAENGNIRACVRDDKVYGNILNESFDEIWIRIYKWRSKIFIPAECKFCPVKGYCNGGCLVENKLLSNMNQQLIQYSIPRRKWKAYIWTQRLLFRKWIHENYKMSRFLYHFIKN